MNALGTPERDPRAESEDEARGTSEVAVPAGKAPPASARVQSASDGLTKSLASIHAPTVWGVIGPLLRPYWWLLLCAILLNGVHGVAMTLQTLTPKWLIGSVLMPTDLTVWGRLTRAAILAGAYLLVSVVFRMAMWHAGYRLFTHVRERAVFVLRARFFRHVNHLCLRFHGEHPSGEIFNYIFGAPLQQVMEFYRRASNMGPSIIFSLASIIFMVGLWDVYLSIVLLGTSLGSVLVGQLSRRRFKAIHRQYQEMEGHVSANVADILRGAKAVKLYHMEESVAEDFDRDAARIADESYWRDIKGHMEFMKQETVGYIGFCLLIVVGTWRFMASETVDAAVITAYCLAYNQTTNWLASLFELTTLWGGAQASIERIGEVLKTTSTTPDPETPKAVLPETGDLLFDDVHFAYNDQSGPVIRGLDLTIPYGQSVAFVGPSGAGKSTISQLALRLYDPQGGTVSLGGVDLRLVKGAEVRARFGVVPQDPFTFRASIRDNIRLAKPEATDGEITEALIRANAWEFVKAMPGQLDEPVGESGSTLSGGQRQRLAIARVLLANPGFFIFDEATSALDTISEELIQRTLEAELAGRTAIFIAHRLATVRNCDRVVVLDRGRVAQDGTYRELATTPGLFRDMVEGQQLLS